MAEQEASLNDLFVAAKAKQDRLDKFDPRSGEFKAEWQSAIKSYEECRDLISQLALFSRNEEVDDISTQNLQYLAIDYLTAELILKSYESDRKTQLQRALTLFESFLSCLEDYDLLNASEKKLFSQYREDKSGFALVSSNNPEQRRNVKVIRFREEKALKDRLKVLREKSQRSHVDEEILRDSYLAELALFAHQTFQALDMISQELSMLQNMPQPEPTRSDQSQEDADERQHERTKDVYSEKLDGPVKIGGLGRRGGPLLDSRGKPLQPFTLTDKRAQMQQGVFRPSHNLPTMSIDEYLEEEKRRGGIIEGGGNANAAPPEPNEDDMDAQDEATMKARQWDEFVEANPKGAGNTINRG